MKRLIGIFLALTMLLTLSPMNIFAANAESTVFSDMKDTDYFAQAATALEQLDILAGYPDGTFGAEKSITRAEMAAIVCRMIDKESDAEKAEGITIFDDISDSHWASGYINIASKEGIISGDGNGKFRPEDDVKYEEAIKMVVCALGYGNDVEADAKDWSAGYIKIADDKGITQNLKGTKGKAATRGDIAVMSYNGLAADAENSKIPATPVASVKSGEYKGSQKVKLTTLTKDADIYYTTDGTTPTVKSTKYTKEFSITKTCTLKAIAVKNGVVSKSVMSENYTIKNISSGGGGGGGSSSAAKYTVSFDLNYAGATGAPASQTVKPGEKASEPASPTREGYSFIGWTTTTSGDVMFNFNTNITANITLYAKWAVQNGNNPVSLDDPDPDVEIYSFETDTYDIPVSETKAVKFTSEIFANIELSNTDVSVVNENGESIGYMHDDGIEGDEIAGDGIYTLNKEFEADAVGNSQYNVLAKGVVSDSINIGYYREYTEQDFVAYEDVTAILDEIALPYRDDDGYLSDDEVVDKLALKLDELKADNIINNYVVYDGCIKIELTDGLEFKYILSFPNRYGGNSEKVKIITYEPYRGTLSSDLNEDMDKASDGNANLIAITDDMYVFSGNYDLQDVTLDNVNKIASAGIVLWIGHGGYDIINGSSIGTGEIANRDTLSKYSNDINNGSIELWSGNRFAVTGGYIKKYVKNLNNTYIYLNTCFSGRDMIDGVDNRYELSQAFIDNGAKAVVGTSNSVLCDYSHKFAFALFEKLTSKDDDGQYYTLSQSLKYAKESVGNTDSQGTEFLILPQNNEQASNYRLGQSTIGYISGNVKDAENGNTIQNALVRVYKNGSLIKSTRTDNFGYYMLELSAGEYIVKITAGNYKSAKMGVNIVENSTTYNETMLLVSIGINTGYANGTISSALTGMGVSDVTLKMRSGWNNIYGNIIHTTQTNENGYYKIEYTPGIYTVEYSKEGYITGYKNIIIGAIDLSAQNASISPLLADGAYRITLSWANEPYDLDSHLTGPIENSTERFHLYYPMAQSNAGHQNSDKYTLDLDNTDIVSRPEVYETTTIIQQLDGVYRFSVHDFTNSESSISTQMANSRATVNVYKGNSNIPVATFHVPTTAVGTIWTVFELNGDTITPINRISTGSSFDISLYSLENDICPLFDETIIMGDIIKK